MPALGALLAAVAALLLHAPLAPTAAVQAPVDRCEGATEGVVAGRVADPALTEISGLAASRRHPGVLWAHNDSGGEPAVSALSVEGADLGTYRLPGATATDWEDLAAGPGPDGEDVLWAADIGDNAAGRDEVVLWRATEPATAPGPGGEGGVLTDVAQVVLRYPSGPVDAEALLADPVDGDLFVVTKEVGGGRVLRAAAEDLDDGATVTLEEVGRLQAVPGDPDPGLLVTGGSVSPDGSLVLLRTYGSVLALARPPGASLGAAFADPPCELPSVSEPQGEALAVLADGSGYVTVSEGERPPVNRFGLAEPAAATTTTGPVEEAAPAADDDGDPPLVAIAVGVGLVAIVLVLLVGVIRAERRR